MAYIAAKAVPERTESLIEAPIDEALIILSLEKSQYFGFTETASAVWSLIDGKKSLQEIAIQLRAQYEASEGVLLADVSDFVMRLQELGLIKASLKDDGGV